MPAVENETTSLWIRPEIRFPRSSYRQWRSGRRFDADNQMIERIVGDSEAVCEKETLIVSRPVVVVELLARAISLKHLEPDETTAGLPFHLCARLVIEKVEERKKHAKMIGKKLDQIGEIVVSLDMSNANLVRGESVVEDL
jgi:hypothetical protein